MAEPTQYAAQERGGRAQYERYFAAMDATMRQKLAFVGAHFLLDPGARIADMGCGSGSGTYELALLNPEIRVIGVDINPESVRLAGDKFKLPNLEFMVGDAAEPLFAAAPLDGVLSSSTLHHVYTFNGYSRDAVRKALRSHLECLREDGVFVLRDFVSAPRDTYVLLEVADEGSRGEKPTELSDADLLLRFARTARPLDRRSGPGFFLEEAAPRRPGTRRFRLEHKWAVEFVLRKDYRENWEVELLEEYTYFTADEFAAELARAGGRLLCAEPYWNPWIVKHRFDGKFRMTAEDGRELGWPATNFVAVAQRTAPGASLRLVERRPSEREPSFLILECAEAGDGEAARRYDLARRPQPVFDVIPWRQVGGRLRILARHGYPRPITRAVPRGPAMIDGARWGGYLIEPIAGMATGNAASAATAVLGRFGIDFGGIGTIAAGLSYYPSPGGIDEVVHSVFVETTRPSPDRPLPPSLSGFSTAGRLRELDAQDVLRAAHVGVLPEARLEINIYALLKRLGIAPDPFIGEELVLRDTPLPVWARRRSLAELIAEPPVAPFVAGAGCAGYLRVVRSVFADQTEEAEGPRTLAEQELEFVLPREQSINSAVALPILGAGEPLVGLETRLLPVPQRHEGNARILTAPAWRLSREVATIDDAKRFAATTLGVAVEDVIPLGAGYFPSAGITPERVHPFAVRVAGARAALAYDFVPLLELLGRLDTLRDGHLLVAILRLAHALGAWDHRS